MTNAEYQKRWRAANKDKVRAYLKSWHARNKARALADSRKRKGLPAPGRECPAVCECCGKPPGKKALSLDHCHRTGKFRGWLCLKCNVAIGMLGDSEHGVALALAYLERSR